MYHKWCHWQTINAQHWTSVCIWLLYSGCRLQKDRKAPSPTSCLHRRFQASRHSNWFAACQGEPFQCKTKWCLFYISFICFLYIFACCVTPFLVYCYYKTSHSWWGPSPVECSPKCIQILSDSMVPTAYELDGTQLPCSPSQLMNTDVAMQTLKEMETQDQAMEAQMPIKSSKKLG